MRINLTPVQQPRTCGTCSLCCKVLAITELEKPVGQWCQHAKKSRGCSIYDTRPESCQAFACSWLSGVQFLEHRPDKIHGVVAPALNSDNALVIYEDPGWPGHASQVLKPFIDSLISDGQFYVVVVCGERRRLIARDDLMGKLKLRLPTDNEALKKLGMFQVEQSE